MSGADDGGTSHRLSRTDSEGRLVFHHGSSCLGPPPYVMIGDADRALGGSIRCVMRGRPEGGGGVTEPLLDDVNKQIVELLQRDGRMSYASIAKSVGLSEAAVRQRVQRLLDHNVMDIVAVTDPLTLGFARQVMVGITVEGDTRPIAKALAEIPAVDYVVLCAGRYDILAELVCTDDDHLLILLNEQVRTIPGVTGTETFLYLKLVKQTYAWGTR